MQEQLAVSDPGPLPGQIPSAGAAPSVMWDPDGHVYKPAARADVQMPAPVKKVMQGVVNEISEASTIAQLRDALLNFVEATTGVAPK
jgi:hypothetical protein